VDVVVSYPKENSVGAGVDVDDVCCPSVGATIRV